MASNRPLSFQHVRPAEPKPFDVDSVRWKPWYVRDSEELVETKAAEVAFGYRLRWRPWFTDGDDAA